MRKLILLAILTASAVVVARAAAWEDAEVRVSKPPATIVAGRIWHATMTLLAQGEPVDTPVARPAVTVWRTSTHERRVFRAVRTKRTGVWRLAIVFAKAGMWRYRADAVRGDPEAPHTTYPPIRVHAAE